MSDNVTDFTGTSRINTPVPKILATAAGAKLETAVVIGWDKDGEFYFSSSEPNGAEVLWMLMAAVHELIGLGRE